MRFIGNQTGAGYLADDSFACLGNIPTTSSIIFKNCIADKGLKAPSSVTASCFKLDSGGAKAGISGVIYINCKAFNANLAVLIFREVL